MRKTKGGFPITQIKQVQGRILYVLWQEDGLPIIELAKRTGLAKTTLTGMLDRMESWNMEQNKKEEIKAVIKNASNVYVASVDENGYPNVKAMFARMQEGNCHYMSTNFSSRRTQYFL